MISRRRLLTAAAWLAICAPTFGLKLKKRDGLITVRAPRGATIGTLRFNGHTCPCGLGRSGIVDGKHEGDGGTPAGIYPLREIRYRPDRLAPPHSHLPVIATGPADGWCDDPADPAYNKPVRLPYPRSTETLWRDDSAYDLLAVIGYNDAPPVPGAGSAIFLHVARTRSDGSVVPTAGCVALAEPDLVTVLAACTPRTVIEIRTV
jgi:L,D-peptidoglycan transpeptidase YkuD (ErfK/YbiS/YcfS/YnhG family)